MHSSHHFTYLRHLHANICDRRAMLRSTMWQMALQMVRMARMTSLRTQCKGWKGWMSQDLNRNELTYIACSYHLARRS